MSDSWKKKVCKDCEFSVSNRCRRFPPTTDGYDKNSDNRYPKVTYMDACFEFRSGDK